VLAWIEATDVNIVPAGRNAHSAGRGDDIIRDIERMNAILAYPPMSRKSTFC
jgi:hypothetical protein